MRREVLRATVALVESLETLAKHVENEPDLKKAVDLLQVGVSGFECPACGEDESLGCLECKARIGQAFGPADLTTIAATFREFGKLVLGSVTDERWGVWVQMGEESLFNEGGNEGGWATEGGQAWAGTRQEAEEYAQELGNKNNPRKVTFTAMPLANGGVVPPQRGN